MAQSKDIDYDLEKKLTRCSVPHCPFVASLHSELCLQHRSRELNYDAEMSDQLRQIKIENACDQAWENLNG